MTTFSRHSAAPASRCSAFTLAEMMVTLTILAVVLASIIPTFAFFTRSIVKSHY